MKKKINTEKQGKRKIDGISNYCNRWCERCAFKDWCSLYDKCQDEDQLFSAMPDEQDREVAELMNFIESMMEEKGIEMEIIPMEINEDNDGMPDLRGVLKHSLYQYAVTAMDMMWDWFVDAEPHMSEIMSEVCILEQEDIESIANALEVIQWNRSLMISKIYRALSDDNTDSRIFVDTDANGTIKVVLIAIDDMFNAWTELLLQFSETEDKIYDILEKLTLLKDKLREEFPLAEQFKRPGFGG